MILVKRINKSGNIQQITYCNLNTTLKFTHHSLHNKTRQLIYWLVSRMQCYLIGRGGVTQDMTCVITHNASCQETLSLQPPPKRGLTCFNNSLWFRLVLLRWDRSRGDGGGDNRESVRAGREE